MDRYDFFSDYAAAKHRIFKNQTSEDVAILNADDEITASWVNGLKAKVILFSTKKELEEGYFLRGNDLICKTSGEEKVLISRNEMTLRGIHNVENVLAAFAATLACGASLESIRETVKKFNAVEHRLEFVSEIDGVKFYNDSKATSVDATLKALEALSEGVGKTILILGGRGKNAPYQPLAELVKSSVRKLVLIGEDADNIENQLKDYAEIIRAETMKDAVKKSFENAESGDSVLLAPACASFDMFESYEQRGTVFKAAVKNLNKISNEI
jgi:UDP-N-acetylmuramoylalanine--D-glutamate ligase